MRHGSLFNGIGGFQLAAQWMGWENVFSCEIDEFCNKVTKHHFPNCIQHGDIKTTDFTIYRGRIDILTGGFPCQPFSQSGKRKGDKDERYLWPEYKRAIKEIQPDWVVGENVHGIINWSGGLVFQEIKNDLESEGYEIFPPYILPAGAVGADHLRNRVWIIANANGQRHERKFEEFGDKIFEMEKSTEALAFHKIKNITNDSISESSVIGTNDGIPHRVERIKALGNAIVPQVAFQIFKAIESLTHGN